jgi:bis(5'-nucleosyl)-tetraphosphatase (symmetrical)
MTSTWVVGDVHGCAAELQLLLEKIDLQAQDLLLSVGDLFHRGPDPAGVLQILQRLGSRFDMVNGNHERSLLRRCKGQATCSIDDLRGDGGTVMHKNALPVAEELIAFIHGRSYLQRRKLCGSAWQQSETTDWLLVHGCVLPGQIPEQIPPSQLVRKGRQENLPNHPYWYETWHGPEFVVFGHAQSAAGLHVDAHGNPWCYGLDTGCVYGGPLTALRLEDLAIMVQPNVGSRVVER